MNQMKYLIGRLLRMNYRGMFAAVGQLHKKT